MHVVLSTTSLLSYSTDMATKPLLGGQPASPTATGYGGAYNNPVDTPSFHGDTPGEDASENASAQPPVPTAPSLDKLETVSGYEGVGFNAGV